MSEHTTVIYNADCPICSREIDSYRRYCAAHGVDIAFQDLQRADLATLGLSPEDAARRLHVIENGTLLSGTPAFLALWEMMPRFRPLARVIGLPGLRHIAAAVYEGVLAPALYAMHRRRVRRANCG